MRMAKTRSLLPRPTRTRFLVECLRDEASHPHSAGYVDGDAVADSSPMTLKPR
jgi:hypothetical protein